MVLNFITQASQRALLAVLQPFFFNSTPPLILGVVFLALTRTFLFENRVHDYNTPDMLQYTRPEPCAPYCDTCTPRELRFRTFDGHCNNLNQTGMGMTFKRFGRSALKDAGRPDPGIYEPDPYLVAEKLLKSPTGKRNYADPYNLFMTVWINFNLHDWIHHDRSLTDPPYTLRWGPKETDTFKLHRTLLDEDGYTLNTETPWWDASQIYGKTEEQAAGLRVPARCELRLDATGNLPLDADGVPQAGFKENWWTGVEILHHMFVLEHNYVCGMLRKAHGTMSEEDLYQTSRLIVAGVLAQIHTTEWTPALLNNDVMNVSMNQNWKGISAAFLEYELEQLHKSMRESLGKKIHIDLQQAILKVVMKLVPGTVGVGHKTELYGTPYSLSEDFVSAYRLHALIPDEFNIAGEKVNASDMLFAKARKVIDRFGMEKLVDSWGHSPPTTLTLQNYPNFLTRVEVPGEDGLRNMAVVDVFRDRERGMVRYNQARRQYGIKPAKKFEDITDNTELVAALKSVYKTVDDVDFFVGCMAESPRPKGYVISNVAFYIFIINASRRILCDRFYQESFNAESYTAEGINHVQSTTFKKLLLRHYPGLKDSIGDVHNAFFKWTGGKKFGAASVKEEL